VHGDHYHVGHGVGILNIGLHDILPCGDQPGLLGCCPEVVEWYLGKAQVGEPYSLNFHNDRPGYPGLGRRLVQVPQARELHAIGLDIVHGVVQSQRAEVRDMVVG
jgi:hypothetical protein